MKRKLLFIVILLFAVTDHSFSQTYMPMLNNATWNVTVADFMNIQNLIIHQGTDVVIGSYTYKKIMDPTTGLDVYLREDIPAKKVYRRVNNADEILYDFSLQVSDTIVLGNSTYTVISITNINVTGGTRRGFLLDNGFFSESWIEGVGNIHNPLRPDYEMPSDPYIYLTCSAQNGTSIYNYGLMNGGTPTDCSMLGIDEENYSIRKITFSPNPFRAEINIASETGFENATLQLYNPVGQMVKEITTVTGRRLTINRENLTVGIYFARLLENGKLLKTHTLIVTD